MSVPHWPAVSGWSGASTAATRSMWPRHRMGRPTSWPARTRSTRWPSCVVWACCWGRSASAVSSTGWTARWTSGARAARPPWISAAPSGPQRSSATYVACYERWTQMLSAPELELAGRSALAAALGRAARRHGGTFIHPHASRGTGPSGTRLSCRRNGKTVATLALVPDESLAAAIVDDTLRRVMRSWPCARPCSAVVLAPAGGVTGPAGAGPVDAVAITGGWILHDDAGDYPVRLVTVQHSRCWLASYTAETTCGDCPG